MSGGPRGTRRDLPRNPPEQRSFSTDRAETTVTNRPAIKTLLKVTVTIGLVALVAYYAGPRRIWVCLRQAHPGVFLLANILTIPLLMAKIIKWHLLARHLGPDITLRRSARSYMHGLVLALITPFASGELARGALLTTSRAAEATGQVVLDKLLDLILVCLLAAAGLAVLAEGTIGWIAFGAAAVLSLGGLIAFATPLPSAVLRRFPRLPMAATFQRIVDSIQRTRKRDLAWVALLGLSFYVLLYVQAYALVWAFLGEAPPLRSVAAYPFITLSTILPIAIGGVGIRESTAVLMSRAFNIPAAVAFNAFFAHWVVLLVIPALVYLPFSARRTAASPRE